MEKTEFRSATIRQNGRTHDTTVNVVPLYGMVYLNVGIGQDDETLFGLSTEKAKELAKALTLAAEAIEEKQK